MAIMTAEMQTKETGMGMVISLRNGLYRKTSYSKVIETVRADEYGVPSGTPLTADRYTPSAVNDMTLAPARGWMGFDETEVGVAVDKPINMMNS